MNYKKIFIKLMLMLGSIVLISTAAYYSSKKLWPAFSCGNLTKQEKKQTALLKKDELQSKGALSKDAALELEKEETSLNKNEQLSNSEMYDPVNWHKHSEQIKEELRSGKVIKLRNMREVLAEEEKHASFSSSVYKVELDNGLQAVFKTTHYGDMSKDQMEEAAFDFSVATKIAYVPPTVNRWLTYDFDGEGECSKLGFLSLFVQTDVDLLSLNKSEFDEFMKKMEPDDYSNFKIFNFVFGNWDTGPDNMLFAEFTRSGKTYSYPISIDNEAMMNIQKVRYGEMPFVRWGRYSDEVSELGEFPFDSAKKSTPESRTEIANRFSFMPTKRAHNFVLFDGYYWAQITESYFDVSGGASEFLYPSSLPKATQEALSKLTGRKLFEILGTTEEEAGDMTKARVAAILERRGLLLEHFA